MNKICVCLIKLHIQKKIYIYIFCIYISNFIIYMFFFISALIAIKCANNFYSSFKLAHFSIAFLIFYKTFQFTCVSHMRWVFAFNTLLNITLKMQNNGLIFVFQSNIKNWWLRNYNYSKIITPLYEANEWCSYEVFLFPYKYISE